MSLCNLHHHAQISLLEKKQIHKICKPLFQNTLFNYAGYSRIFPEKKTWLGLYSNPHVVHEALEAGYIPPILDSSGITVPNGFHLNLDLAEVLKKQFQGEIIDQFYKYLEEPLLRDNTLRGICYIQKHQHYQDFFYFSSSVPLEYIRGYSLNMLETLRSFTEYFLFHLKDTIRMASSFETPLPTMRSFKRKTNPQESRFFGESEETLFHLKNIFHLKKHRIPSENADHYLSSQEMNCLLQLAKGMNGRQAAKNLSISYRTFETHWQKIKNKTGITEKHQLIEKLIKISNGK